MLQIKQVNNEAIEFPTQEVGIAAKSCGTNLVCDAVLIWCYRYMAI